MIAAQEMNLLQMIFGGSWIGVGVMLLLLILSMASLYFIVDHFLTIRQQRMFPESQLNELEQLIAAKRSTKRLTSATSVSTTRWPDA